MDFFSINLLKTQTKVTSANSAPKDRHNINVVYKNNNHKPDEKSNVIGVKNWDGQERRSGKDRRQINTVQQARLDARNKTDRRAGKLSLQI